ncbi:MAG TPA: methyltransferase [Brevundimonas sp.]|uniref:tRNA1(Val) (adenine(37)-N6)-methyltransferase n=1 Tax=Brevundimonas sp. TaxID=1871086 RepID=UPI002EDA1DE2
MTVAAPPPEVAEIVENALLGGRVRLRQPAKGYRAGMDAALLAAAVDCQSGQRVIEAGCGAGAVLMQIAARRPGVALTGLERDAAMADLARENARLNVADADILSGDVAAGFRALGLEPFDWAVSNPPFFDDPGALREPGRGKRGAWMADDGLSAWTGFLLKAVREGGRIVLIHRADRLPDLLSLLGEKAGSFAVRGVHPHADEPAKRVLVQATRTGKAPLRLLPPLVLHERGGAKHTPEAEAILRGEAGLGW